MLVKTQGIFSMNLDFLPLKSYYNIVEGNALRIDWSSVVSSDEFDYIMGNSPFLGYSMQDKSQKADILSVYVDERTAQAIFDARALYPDCILADLYDELTMPPELRKAHVANDMAVMEAYGFFMEPTPEHPSKWYSPSETVAALMNMYQELVKKSNG